MDTNIDDTFKRYFEVGMLLVVILNVILIVYQFISNRDCQLSVKEAELAFLVIFYLELISKILAYGPGRYFSHFFNMYVSRLFYFLTFLI